MRERPTHLLPFLLLALAACTLPANPPVEQVGVSESSVAVTVAADAPTVVPDVNLAETRPTLSDAVTPDWLHGSWEQRQEMPVPLHGVPAAGYDGVLYVLGGSDRAGGIENRGRVVAYQP